MGCRPAATAVSGTSDPHPTGQLVPQAPHPNRPDKHQCERSRRKYRDLCKSGHAQDGKPRTAQSAPEVGLGCGSVAPAAGGIALLVCLSVPGGCRVPQPTVCLSSTDAARQRGRWRLALSPDSAIGLIPHELEDDLGFDEDRESPTGGGAAARSASTFAADDLERLALGHKAVSVPAGSSQRPGRDNHWPVMTFTPDRETRYPDPELLLTQVIPSCLLAQR